MGFKIFFYGVVCVTFFICSNPALSREYTTSAGWTIIDNEDGCIAAMDYDGPGNTNLVISIINADTVLMGLANANWTTRDDQKYDLTFHFDEEVYSGGISIGSSFNGTRGFASRFPIGALDAFAKARSLEVYRGNVSVDQLKLGGSAAAAQAIKSCFSRNVAARARADAADRAYKERWAHIATNPFPIEDPNVRPPNSPPQPRGNMTSWVTADDYPPKAMREERGGRVTLRITVGSDGRVKKCDVVTSSGSEDLDQASCNVLTRRARFVPATDNQGKPTEGLFERTLTWSIPKDVEPTMLAR